MDVFDPGSDDEANRDFSSRKLINQLKTGDVLGEMGFLRSVPRSATVIATDAVELLQMNWKMIRRLQWLYPPTAHRFFFNLMTLICDRLENLTECFAEIKVLDDTTGLYNRENFMKILDAEIQRSRRCRTSLSLCLMQLDFDTGELTLDSMQKEEFLSILSDAFLKEIGSCDTLSRFDEYTFGLLIPHSLLDEAHLLCDRLRHIFEETNNAADGIGATLNLGLADFMPENDEGGDGLLSRATATLQVKKIKIDPVYPDDI
jgi:GGDEF domain-containing protein